MSEITDDEIELVLERVKQLFPSDINLQSCKESLSKEELIKEIEERTERGKLFVKVQMACLRSFSEDKRFEDLNSLKEAEEDN